MLLPELRVLQMFHDKNVVKKKTKETQFQVPINELWIKDPARQLGLNGPFVMEHRPL